MDDTVLNKLEYPAILDRLSRRCHFSVAAERARAIRPSTDPDQVRYLQSVTAEAVALLRAYPDLTIGGARDIRDLIRRAQYGSRLQPGDFLVIQDTIIAARALRQTFARIPDAEEQFPNLGQFIDHLADLSDLEQLINRTVGPRGDILDTASEALARIRREVRISHSRLMDRLNSLLNSSRYAAILQDQIVTTRDGRYVVPVRAEARGALPGVVHDTSASGQTLFVEPFDVVELNNRWREQQAAEQHEIDRILDELSHHVAERAATLNQTVDGIAALDLAFAKARLAFDMDATQPRTWHPSPATSRPQDGEGTPSPSHPTHRIKLTRARHPLLDPAKVVPIDISLGETFRVLVITGPNTGGKTVTLKTVGLLVLMAQSGLFIPADDSSELSVFPSVFVDIGDEQSIAQNLSTFSAHMRSIIDMLRNVTPDSLVLLDELGAGTDPQEGSALARAILKELLNRGPLVIATTHFSEVKAFAYATPGIENASVEFDVKTLSPTYRLRIGVPGESNALAIAQRLGLEPAVLDAARDMLSPDDQRTDILLQDIRRRREEAEEALKRVQQTEAEAQQLRRLAARTLRTAEEERQQARAEALAEAERELAELRETLRALQRDREMVAATRDHLEERRRQVEHAADIVKSFRRDRVERAHAGAAATKRRSLRPGDRVRILSLGGIDGEVTAIEDGFADVQLGALKTRQPIEALERLGRAKEPESQRRITRPALEESVPMEIDLRGQRASEVPEMLERYLDQAARAGLPSVRIIHGKGTGALREVVRNHLHNHPLIERAELAPPNQGGDGVTIAYLRDHA